MTLLVAEPGVMPFLREQSTEEKAPPPAPVSKFRLMLYRPRRGEDMATFEEVRKSLTKEKAEELLKAGKTPGQIGTMYNAPPPVIGKLFREYGLTYEGKKRPAGVEPKKKQKKAPAAQVAFQASGVFAVQEAQDIIDGVLTLLQTMPAGSIRLQLQMTRED